MVSDYQRKLIGIVSPEKATSSKPSVSSAPTEAGDILRKKLNIR